ncbi:hypothetical protein GCWU000325_00730 [Alloprevotella tannerae ATCC 51259]|uniref:Uncharacterized protein n=1 Tax=Alloprevotella tannerae ATCC 51259 TaxID=626522 RepID=C9LEU9_9BACT|nr:hypothetical protein GCWU000325_00730 [Alloprevotella tannerae ATCC 51259]
MLTQSVNSASASSSIVNPLGLVFQNKPTPAGGNPEGPSLRACWGCFARYDQIL